MARDTIGGGDETVGSIAVALFPLLPTPLPMKVDPPPRFFLAGTWREHVPSGRTMVPVRAARPLGRAGLAELERMGPIRVPVPEGYFLGPTATV